MFVEYQDRPLISYDASGSLTDEFLRIWQALPQEEREAIGKRIVLDMPGHAAFVCGKAVISPILRPHSGGIGSEVSKHT